MSHETRKAGPLAIQPALMKAIPMDIVEIMRSPLTQSGRSGPFLRLVLAEAASYGMPPQVIATLDDVAAMLGLYEPLPANQAAHVAGPMVQWRTTRVQPTHETVVDVEHLALKQRCLIAFGGAPPGHMVGTAEIVSAMGNLHTAEEVRPPKPYWELFQWAATDVLSKLTGDPPEVVLKAKGWPAISDDDVLRPGGRLYPTYQEVATHIRRFTIGAMAEAPDNPRQILRPLAQLFLRSHKRHLAEAEAQGDVRMIDGLKSSLRTITTMFPDLISDQSPAKPEGGAAA
jgi:hypothetical protein